MKRTLSLALIPVLALGSKALAQEKVVVYSTSFEPLARALFFKCLKKIRELK